MGGRKCRQVEEINKKRAMKLFDVPYANVQPYSGSRNFAVYMATCNQGHNHGSTHWETPHPWTRIFSAIYFNSVQWCLTRKMEDGLFDFDAIRALASISQNSYGLAHRPILRIPFENLQKSLMKSAHTSRRYSPYRGTCRSGQHLPVPHVHIVTTTTHKTLRGPRGGLSWSRKKVLKKIQNSPKDQ
jgi:glycine hydroxymethyltransferase